MNKKMLLVLLAVATIGAFALSAYSWGPYNHAMRGTAQWCTAPQGPAHAMNGYTMGNGPHRRFDEQQFQGADFDRRQAHGRHGRSGFANRFSGPCW